MGKAKEVRRLYTHRGYVLRGQLLQYRSLARIIQAQEQDSSLLLRIGSQFTQQR